MNLLTYTKKLSEKIKFYDRIAANPFSDSRKTNPFENPFFKPMNITIIWVEDDNSERY